MPSNDLRQARRLKLRDLQMLQALAEAGSMAAAAEQLALSQPAISKAMSEMEHSLGAQLLDRSSRGVALTESGRVWLERGRVILDEARQGMMDLEHLSDPTRGEVRIGTTEPATVLVSEIVNALSRRHPRITFQIAVSDTPSLRRELRERKLDVLIAFWTTDWMPTTDADDLKADILYKAAFTVMADHRHPLVRQRELSLCNLMGEHWTLPPPDALQGRLVEDFFRRRKLKLPDAVVTTISTYMSLNLLATGRFLSILPVTMLRHPSNRAWLRALSVDPGDTAGTIAVITLKKRRAGGAVKLFVDESRSVCRDAIWTK
jgi:DNA-binding transcriptional LysR family regulator